MSEQKALTTKDDPIYQMLMSYKGAIASVLPKHMTPEKMLRTAYTVIHRTPKLSQCTPISLINGILEISMLGLDIGRTAHLIPFGKEAVVIVDYKGLIELAHRSEKVASTPLKPVYKNDEFDYAEGTERYIRHKPARKNRGELTAAYAIVNFTDKNYDFEVVNPEDIETTKKRSPGAKKADSPWNTEDEWTMWCKTAFRRLAKRIPQSPDLQRAAYLEELIEAGLKQNISHVIDADFKEINQSLSPQPQSDPEKTKSDLNQKLKDMKERGQTKEENLDAEVQNCPINNLTVKLGKCKTCEQQDKCQAYKEFKYNQ